MSNNDERKFLHDLASPLTSAMFLADILLDNMQAKPNCVPEELSQVQQIYKAMEKIQHMLQSRREILIAGGV